MKNIFLLISILLVFTNGCGQKSDRPSDLEKEDQNQMGSGTNTEE